MTDYVAESSVGWLDHNAKDSQRMRELISAFGDRQSIDNLGIGIVRDSISRRARSIAEPRRLRISAPLESPVA